MKDKLDTILDNQSKIMADIQYIKGYLKGFGKCDSKQEPVVEWKPTPQERAFDTKEELDEYVKNNPLATCKGIATKDLVKFIKENRNKFVFLKEANLRFADLSGANLRFANLRFADLRDAKYDNYTKFLDGFTIPNTMIKQ